MLANRLRFSSSHATFGPNALVIRFPVGYDTARDDCAAEGNLQRMQDALKRVTGQQIAVRIETDTSAAARTATTAGPAHAGLAPSNSKKALEALPLFKKAREALGAEIRAIDEDFNPSAAPRTNKDKDSDADTDEEQG